MRKKLVGIHYMVKWTQKNNKTEASAVLNIYKKFIGKTDDEIVEKALKHLRHEVKDLYPVDRYSSIVDVKYINVDHVDYPIDEGEKYHFCL